MPVDPATPGRSTDAILPERGGDQAWKASDDPHSAADAERWDQDGLTEDQSTATAIALASPAGDAEPGLLTDRLTMLG